RRGAGHPAMICARSLFIMSVVKPGTGECCHTPPRSSNFLPSAVIAAPSLPADHCEMAVSLGFTAWARAGAAAATIPAAPARTARRRMAFMAAPPIFLLSTDTAPEDPPEASTFCALVPRAAHYAPLATRFNVEVRWKHAAEAIAGRPRGSEVRS